MKRVIVSYLGKITEAYHVDLTSVSLIYEDLILNGPVQNPQTRTEEYFTDTEYMVFVQGRWGRAEIEEIFTNEEYLIIRDVSGERYDVSFKDPNIMRMDEIDILSENENYTRAWATNFNWTLDDYALNRFSNAPKAGDPRRTVVSFGTGSGVVTDADKDYFSEQMSELGLTIA